MHPLAGADIFTLFRLLRRNGPIAPRHLPAATAVAAAALARSPVTALEHLYVQHRRRRMSAMPAPVFILGHWRSGTTHLYNILTRAEFGFVSPFAAGMPWELLSLARWLRPLLTRMLPKTRYVDRIAVRADSPQEDEIPLGSMNPISVYHGVYFPEHFAEHFHRGMFLDGCTLEEIKSWRQRFSYFMDKLWLDQKRRLVIKNPVYTARVPLLREMYPDARFIHIHRNPHDVYRSTKRFYQTLLARFAWQDPRHIDVEPFVLEGYDRLMRRVTADTKELPDNRFIEIRYDELDADPLACVKRIGEQLELEEIEAGESAIETYLDSVRHYEKTAFADEGQDRALVERHWGDHFERFGYTASPFKARSASS